MARRLETLDFTPTLNAFNDVLVCPSGQKLEPVGCSCFSDGTHAYNWVFFIHRAGGAYVYLDELDIAAGSPSAKRTSWQGVALLAGDALTVFPFTSGTTTAGTNLGYVVVDPS